MDKDFWLLGHGHHSYQSLIGEQVFLGPGSGQSKFSRRTPNSSKYLENVFNLNKAGLSLLSYELNSKMAEMLKRWPKVVTVKFTQISSFEKHEWLRNLCRTNFERDIFYQFKNLKDFQKAWNTKTLKEVSLSDFMENHIQLNISYEEPEKILKCEGEEVFAFRRNIDVIKIQYDSINVANYDAIRDIRMHMPTK